MTQGFCVWASSTFRRRTIGLLSLFVFAAASSSSVASRSTSASEWNPATRQVVHVLRVSVSFCASPPRRLSSQTWVCLHREQTERKPFAIGLQRGWEELAPSAVNAMASPPVAAIIQIATRTCLIPIGVEIEYAIHWPSGVICGREPRESENSRDGNRTRRGSGC